ncbi:MAG: hypothetical protein ACRD3F_01265, partial [Acidobacteriaceae bacterium]
GRTKMRTYVKHVSPAVVIFLVMASFPFAGVWAQSAPQNPRAWMRYARIGAYGLKADNAAEIVRKAEESGVSGIEVDNDITGRYESFVDPAAKLQAIRKVATLAHQHGNHAFVYISGFECITANADSAPHSMAKDHPDWLQRKRSGAPAIFHAGIAFWVKRGDEDAWVTPYAPGWRKMYMERVRQIAATGIDGIYLDIPYWKTDFTGWENSWASFDKYTVAAFKKQTGLNAMDPKQVKLGDYNDPGFREWINFRIQTITDFLADVRKNAVSVNPKIALIPEIWPGIEQSAVSTGADVYQIYPVVDAIAHEYEFGDGDDHTAASRGEFDWFMYQAGIGSFRAFAQGKPTWILNYSWDGNTRVKPSDAMKNLAMSEVIADANFWDAPGHVMAGSNDLATRKQIFAWIKQNQDALFSPRKPLGGVGVYFSDSTRNFYPDFVRHYRGVLLLLLRKHVQFQIVTPRTLAGFAGKTIVLPGVRVLSSGEMADLRNFTARGGRLILTGPGDPKLEKLRHSVSFANSPGLEYLEAAEKDFEDAPLDSQSAFFKALGDESEFSVQASPDLVAYVAEANGKTHWYFANFKGLKKGDATVPVPVRNVTITAPAEVGSVLHLVPFLGGPETVTGRVQNGRVEFVIPEIQRAAIAWTDHSAPGD